MHKIYVYNESNLHLVRLESPSIHVVALALQRHTRIRQQDSEEEVRTTNEQLQQMFVQQKTTKEELERVNKECKVLETKMRDEQWQAQQAKEEIQRNKERLEQNKQTIETVEREGEERVNTMKTIGAVSAVTSIVGSVGTAGAVAASIFFPPAGLLVAGSGSHTLEGQ